jgi:ABC-2 type transport system permease protein
MPIFDQGYQHWHGALSGHLWRWLTITRNGVRANLKNRWRMLIVLAAWIPALALAGILVVWGLVEQESKIVAPILALFRDLPAEIRTGPRNYRMTIWTIAFQYFFQIEIFFSMIVVVMIGPNLVSQDLRFNALPLYFSRPLRRFDYFLGKLGVIGVFLSAVAIAPPLLAYLLGLCFSLDLSVVKDTWRILAASLGYGLIIVLSAGTLMLALSSLSRNSRYVAAFWIGIWFVSNVVSTVLIQTVRRDWCPMLSYTANLQRICTALLDTQSAWAKIGNFFSDPQRRDATLAGLIGPTYPWYWSALVLAGLFGLSLWILSFRVKSLDRLK